MPSPWDYRSDQRAAFLLASRYFIVLADEKMNPLYDYAYMKGAKYSRMKNTGKGFFVPIDEPAEQVRFDSYNVARSALITIGSTPVANVPVGQYNLVVVRTVDWEPTVVLPYYVTEEIPNEQLATEQRTSDVGHEALQRLDASLYPKSMEYGQGRNDG